jgi:hypothetical protein
MCVEAQSGIVTTKNAGGERQRVSIVDEKE